MHIVFAGGGAAGHWFPGLTVAHQVRALAPRARVTFLGAGNGFESRNATIAGFQYISLWSNPPAAGFARAWRFLTDQLAASRAARRYFKRYRPDVVVGLGGPTSAPALRAAESLHLPLVLLEYNALPCETTRKFAAGAAAVFGGFPSLSDHLDDPGPVHIVGNPIRAAFSRAFRLREQALVARARAIRKGHLAPRQLVVLAGTSADGSLLNEQVPKALYKLRSELAGWKIVHQTGARGKRSTQSLYRKLGLTVDVTSFIPDMPRVLLASDLAIVRPGGITLFELAASGVPAVAIPSDSDSERHQAANAAAFGPAACRVVPEADGGHRLDDRLALALGELVAGPGMRLRMSAAILKHARPDAAQQVASMVLELAQSRSLLNVA